MSNNCTRQMQCFEPFRADLWRNWGYSFGKWWESLATILEQWRASSITWPNNLDFFFQFFFKFSLLYRLSFHVDVVNHKFWKLYIKTINDWDPGLNLLNLDDPGSELRYHQKLGVKQHRLVSLQIQQCLQTLFLCPDLLISDQRFFATSSNHNVAYW